MPWTPSRVRILRELGVHWAMPERGENKAPASMPAGSAATAPQLEGQVQPAVPPPSGGRPDSIGQPAAAAVGSDPPRIGLQAPVDVQGLDWPALRDSVAACRACALCQTRTQTVFGVGHPSAHWMVVGEAPGEQEDLRGEPFVGAAGRLLDQMLAALQLTRAVAQPDSEPSRGPAGDQPLDSRQVYIANTLKCRPPGNRNPLPDELARCEPYLQRQIALLRPHIILAMGRFAVQSLLRSSEPVGKLRGRVHHYQGVPLIVTYHPAYLLRNPLDKSRAWDDLCLAAATYERQRAAVSSGTAADSTA